MTEAAAAMERRHTAYIAGAKFRQMDEQVHLAGLAEGAEIDLKPEPTNKYDPNAVQVIHDGHHVGYVPRDLSAEVARLFAQGRILRTVKGKGLMIRIYYSEEPKE
jgi:hypothetical protein